LSERFGKFHFGTFCSAQGRIIDRNGKFCFPIQLIPFEIPSTLRRTAPSNSAENYGDGTTGRPWNAGERAAVYFPAQAFVAQKTLFFNGRSAE
jgi:hypothetical protein